MEYYKVLRYKNTCLDKEVFNQMEAIVEKLMEELDDVME